MANFWRTHGMGSTSRNTMQETTTFFIDNYGLFLCSLHMYFQYACYINYINGVSRYSMNVWVLYSLLHIIIHVTSVCIGATINNWWEYYDVIVLLGDPLHIHIHHLWVYFNSNILLKKLNNYYSLCIPFLFKKYMCAQQFDKCVLNAFNVKPLSSIGISGILFSFPNGL